MSLFPFLLLALIPLSFFLFLLYNFPSISPFIVPFFSSFCFRFHFSPFHLSFSAPPFSPVFFHFPPFFSFSLALSSLNFQLPTSVCCALYESRCAFVCLRLYWKVMEERMEGVGEMKGWRNVGGSNGVERKDKMRRG